MTPTFTFAVIDERLLALPEGTHVLTGLDPVLFAVGLLAAFPATVSAA
ncbi:hypothetical protein [Amycolatopsis sp. NPDC003676]